MSRITALSMLFVVGCSDVPRLQSEYRAATQDAEVQYGIALDRLQQVQDPAWERATEAEIRQQLGPEPADVKEELEAVEDRTRKLWFAMERLLIEPVSEERAQRRRELSKESDAARARLEELTEQLAVRLQWESATEKLRKSVDTDPELQSAIRARVEKDPKAQPYRDARDELVAKLQEVRRLRDALRDAGATPSIPDWLPRAVSEYERYGVEW